MSNPFNMTDIQLRKCEAYLAGRQTENQMYTLLKTYRGEFIQAFGWKSSQTDPVPVMLNKFCSFATR